MDTPDTTPTNKPVYIPATGNSQGVDNSATRSPYAQRVMPIPPASTGPMAGAANVPPLLQSQADLKS